MRNTFLLLLLACCLHASSQTLAGPMTAGYQRILALAPAFASADAQEQNPASVAALTRPSLALSAERRFFLKELSVYRVHGVLPVRGGTAGAGLVYGGHAGWQEFALRGTYARRLGTRAAVGVAMQWLQAGNATYGRGGALLADVGFRCALAPSVYAGVSIRNPARVRLGKSGGERLPAAYALGLAWERPEQWVLGAELLHRDGLPPSVHVGAEYIFARSLRARCGIDSGAPAAWLGVGAKTAHLLLNVTVALHRELGPSPLLQLIYPAQ